MKKFLSSLEHVAVRVALNPRLRPAEHELAVKLAKSVMLRAGASSAVVGLVVGLIDHFVR